MKLYIGEKPDVGKNIAPFLGKNLRPTREFIEVDGHTTVSWCFGHLLRLAEPQEYSAELKSWQMSTLPIVLPAPPRYVPVDRTANQLRVLGKLLAEATEIFHVGDPDREGQLIVDLVLAHFNIKKPVQRIWLNALDDTSIRAALAKPVSNTTYQGLSRAARTRAIADQSIGINFSRAVTLASRVTGHGELITVGRVQTPTLALVVARDREIANFKPVTFYSPHITVIAGESTFKATWVPAEGIQLDTDGRLIDITVAKAILAGLPANGTIETSTNEIKYENQPGLFSLSLLQQAASAIFGYGAQRTLDIAQSLYETHKLTTYPRTDSTNLKVAQHAEGQSVLGAISNNYPAYGAFCASADLSQRTLVWNDKKVTAHHAIIPTAKKMSIEGLSKAEQDIYQLICRSYIAQFLPKYAYQARIIISLFGDQRFRATGRTAVEAGWKALYATGEKADAAEEGETDSDVPSMLPPVKEGDAVAQRFGQINPGKTSPPSPYTEGTLIRDMSNIHRVVSGWVRSGVREVDPDLVALLRDTSGIGTEATRAPIIEHHKELKFLLAKGKTLRSSELGQRIHDLIHQVDPQLTDPVLTAMFEQSLAAIEEGRIEASAFVDMQNRWIAEIIERLKSGDITLATRKDAVQCPKCAKAYLIRRLKKGTKEAFFSCGRYPDCDYACPEDPSTKRPNTIGRKEPKVSSS